MRSWKTLFCFFGASGGFLVGGQEGERSLSREIRKQKPWLPQPSMRTVGPRAGGFVVCSAAESFLPALHSWKRTIVGSWRSTFRYGQVVGGSKEPRRLVLVRLLLLVRSQPEYSYGSATRSPS